MKTKNKKLLTNIIFVVFFVMIFGSICMLGIYLNEKCWWSVIITDIVLAIVMVFGIKYIYKLNIFISIILLVLLMVLQTFSGPVWNIVMFPIVVAIAFVSKKVFFTHKKETINAEN